MWKRKYYTDTVPEGLLVEALNAIDGQGMIVLTVIPGEFRIIYDSHNNISKTRDFLIIKYEEKG